MGARLLITVMLTHVINKLNSCAHMITRIYILVLKQPPVQDIFVCVTVQEEVIKVMTAVFHCRNNETFRCSAN